MAEFSKFKEGDKVRVLVNAETEKLQVDMKAQIVGRIGKVMGDPNLIVHNGKRQIPVNLGEMIARIPEEDLIKVD